MQHSITIKTITCLVMAAGIGVAAAKPNYSGTWVMDRSRSIGIPPGMEHTMTVLHTGDQIKIENKLVTPQGERTYSDLYTLDGKETEFTQQGPQGPGAKGKRTAKWLPNERGILVSEETTVNTPHGPAPNLLTRKWLLAADGNTLTVDFYHDTPNGSFESKRIFVRK